MKFFQQLVSIATSTILLSVLPQFSVSNLSSLHSRIKFNSQALAGIEQNYVPPKDRERRARTEGAGSRGCDQDISVSLNLLAPNNHVPVTVSSHPTFFWYVSNTSLPMRFILTEPGVEKPVWKQRIKPERAGIVTLKLPSKVPGLKVGKDYRWTVSLICDENIHSKNPYAYAWIERVPATPELAQKLVAVSQERDRSLIYAQSGVWYDALVSIYNAYNVNPQDKLAKWYLSRLLAQVGLTEVVNRESHQSNGK